MSREAAFSALFAAVSAAWPWGLASRRMKLWSEVPAALRPAFFQLESGPETYQWASPAIPKRTFEAKLFLYFDARDPTTPGATRSTPRSTPSTRRLRPPAPTPRLGRQTLGGAVHDCKIWASRCATPATSTATGWRWSACGWWGREGHRLIEIVADATNVKVTYGRCLMRGIEITPRSMMYLRQCLVYIARCDGNYRVPLYDSFVNNKFIFI